MAGRSGGRDTIASQFHGDFLDPLVMFDPSGDTLPLLNRDGRCRRAALDALAKGVPFPKLVDLLIREHGEQFRTPDDARRYARDMVARYCERA